MGFKLSRIFSSIDDSCLKQAVDRGEWICSMCGSKWSDASHGEGWLPFACPEYKTRAEVTARGYNGRTVQPAGKRPGGGATRP
jgi:hypothetical protein